MQMVFIALFGSFSYEMIVVRWSYYDLALKKIRSWSLDQPLSWDQILIFRTETKMCPKKKTTKNFKGFRLDFVVSSTKTKRRWEKCLKTCLMRFIHFLRIQMQKFGSKIMLWIQNLQNLGLKRLELTHP